MLPNVSTAVKAYMQKLIFFKVEKSIVNYEEVETKIRIETMGCRQPVDPQKLNIHNRGQRAWKYENLHLLPKVVLNIDDIIEFNSIKYRVVEKYDFSEYGYIEYMIAQTFEE